DNKLEAYLNASDAFVALCTPDDEDVNHTFRPRANIVDEIQRARNNPHLRDRIQVLKAPGVVLPSNINPSYESLDVEDVPGAAEVVLRQPVAWGVRSKGDGSSNSPSPPLPRSVVGDLIKELDLGDWDEATRRAYGMLSKERRPNHESVVQQLGEFLVAADDNTQILLAGSILESIARLDLDLIRVSLVEALAMEDDFSKRSTAASILWIMAEDAPGRMPI